MSVNVIEGPTEEFNPVEERCDRCGARGYVKATKLDTELVFCNHHGNEFGPGLLAKGFIITSVPI